jgi:arsenate reductase (glutaredoxin)
MIKIYHNPRCSKSRETLVLLKEGKEKLEIVEYLKTPPTESELKKIISKLDISAEDLVRKGDELYKQKYKDKKISNDQWIKILSENPSLIERPIVVKGDQAVIGRPPSNIAKLL